MGKTQRRQAAGTGAVPGAVSTAEAPKRNRGDKPGYNYCLSLPTDVADRLKSVAKRSGRSIHKEIEMAIAMHLHVQETRLAREEAEVARITKELGG